MSIFTNKELNAIEGQFLLSYHMCDRCYHMIVLWLEYDATLSSRGRRVYLLPQLIEAGCQMYTRNDFMILNVSRHPACTERVLLRQRTTSKIR